MQVNTVLPDAVNVLFGYHLLAPSVRETLAGQRVILYQLEQLPERNGWFTPEREAMLSAAWAVWDYSEENAAFLRARGLQRVFTVPIGFHPDLQRIRHLPEGEKDIDVLFYGAANPRRTAVIDALRRRLRTEWLNGVYGEVRDAWIARSRVVLNLHFYPARILEQVRLAYLVNNRCFVVSEESGDNPFGDGVVMARLDELPEVCARFAADPQARLERARRGYEAFRRRPMAGHLRRVLQEMHLL
jgi:hypothetical protein